MYRYACQWCRGDDVLFSARWLTQEITTKPPRGVRASLATSSLALPGVTFGNIAFRGKANSKNRPVGCGLRLQPRGSDLFSRRLHSSVKVQRSFLDSVIGRSNWLLPVAEAVSPAHQPHAAAPAFPVAEMNIRIEASPVHTGR